MKSPHAMPAAEKTAAKKQLVRARAAKQEKEEKQLVVGSAAKEEKGAKQLVVACAAKEEKVEKQQVVARADKEKEVVGEKQLVEPRVDVQAEVQISYERYMQIGYKELERLTLENYSLSGSAKFGKFVQ